MQVGITQHLALHRPHQFPSGFVASDLLGHFRAQLGLHRGLCFKRIESGRCICGCRRHVAFFIEYRVEGRGYGV